MTFIPRNANSSKPAVWRFAIIYYCKRPNWSKGVRLATIGPTTLPKLIAMKAGQ